MSRTRAIRILVMIAWAIVCLAARSVAAETEMNVGTVIEPTPLWFTLKLLVGGWGLVLLVSGTRCGRGTIGTVAMAVGLGAGIGLLGTKGILPALLVAFAGYAVILGLEARWPRFAVALSSFWPLPAMWAVWLLVTGSFDRRAPLVIGLALFGVVLGALRPAAALTLQASALGAICFGLVQSVLPGPEVILLAFVASVAGHILLALIRDGNAADEERGPAAERWAQSLRWGGIAMFGLVMLVCWTAPSYGPPSAANPERVNRLVEKAELERPGLVIGAENNLYLSGRASVFAVVSARELIRDRLLLPVTGRLLSPAVRSLRAVKDENELAAMGRAAAITSKTFAEIAPMIEPGVSESEIDRAIRASFARHGADGIAFKGIVASGANAVLPHYQRNDDVMREGFVVIDIGCSVGGYASDMTRTFAVHGEASEAQRRLLDVAAEAHRVARDELKPGASMKDLDALAKQVISDAGFDGFMTHSVGHHVGLNVHDPGTDELAAGMVVTIEPGIYIPAGASVDPAYWDLGVRIEDSYVVTVDGCEALTSFPW